LEILARAQPIENDNRPFLELIRQEAIHLPWGTTILIITSQAAQEILPTVFFLKRTGFQVTLILVQSPGTYIQTRAETVEQIQEWGCPIFRIGREKDVKAWVSAS